MADRVMGFNDRLIELTYKYELIIEAGAFLLLFVLLIEIFGVGIDIIALFGAILFVSIIANQWLLIEKRKYADERLRNNTRKCSVEHNIYDNVPVS